MGDLYYGKITPSAFSATTAATGYPASNIGNESIDMPWKATVAGTGDPSDVIFTLSVAQMVKGLLLSDVNFASAAVAKSPDGTTYSSVGTITSYADKWTDRRRALIVVNDANVKTLKITVSAGTPLDGTTQWRIGAGYLFSSTVALPRMPDFGMKVRAIYPKVQTELANKQLPQALTGVDILELSLPYNRRYDQDVLEMLRRARGGTVGLSLVPTNYTELVLPVYHVANNIEETLGMLDVSQLTIDLRERT